MSRLASFQDILDAQERIGGEFQDEEDDDLDAAIRRRQVPLAPEGSAVDRFRLRQSLVKSMEKIGWAFTSALCTVTFADDDREIRVGPRRRCYFVCLFRAEVHDADGCDGWAWHHIAHCVRRCCGR